MLFPDGTRASSVVPAFTTIFAGAFVFVPPTVQLELALGASFATSHVPHQM